MLFAIRNCTTHCLEADWSPVDEHPDSEGAVAVKLAIWKFVRSPDGLPPVSLRGTDWITQVRANLTNLLSELGVKDIPGLGRTFQKRGLDDSQIEFALFEEQSLFPAIKYDTIHRVKGESIDGVFVTGSKKFFDKVVADVTSSLESEERRLAYGATGVLDFLSNRPTSMTASLSGNVIAHNLRLVDCRPDDLSLDLKKFEPKLGRAVCSKHRMRQTRDLW